MKFKPLLWVFFVLSGCIGSHQTLPSDPKIIEGVRWPKHTVINPTGIAQDGSIQMWKVAGPFLRKDRIIADIWKDESKFNVALPAALIKGGKASWFPFSAGADGIVDLSEAFFLFNPSTVGMHFEEKFYAYAVSTIVSENEQTIDLKFGGNQGLHFYVNGELLCKEPEYSLNSPKKQKVQLRKGANYIVVGTGFDYRNLLNPSVATVEKGAMPGGWKFFVKLEPSDSKVSVKLADVPEKPAVRLQGTPFLIQKDGTLHQEAALWITHGNPKTLSGSAVISVNKQTYNIDLPKIPFGKSRHPVFLPNPKETTLVTGTVQAGQYKLNLSEQLVPQAEWEIFLVQTAHTDHGFTDPVPVVRELGTRIIDKAVDYCERDPDYRWNIEHSWLAVEYDKERSQDRFKRLLHQIKSGRIHVSPVFANPQADAWGEELFRSFYPFHAFSKKYGVTTEGQILNDTPGNMWAYVEALAGVGAKYLMTGPNEVFNDYSYQVNLPYLYWWEGPSGRRILVYKTEHYFEHWPIGLASGLEAMYRQIPFRIARMQERKYTSHAFIIQGTHYDLGGAYEGFHRLAKEWNKCYAYPRFQTATISEAFRGMEKRSFTDTPVIRGDGSGHWDTIGRDFENNSNLRRARSQLTTAETMATIYKWLRKDAGYPRGEINEIYSKIWHLTSHGSGVSWPGISTPFEQLAEEENRRLLGLEARIRSAALVDNYLIKMSYWESLYQPVIGLLTNDAAIVVNPLPWKRDAVVEIQFPEKLGHQIVVQDPESGILCPSVLEDQRLFFLAKDLPPTGYRRYKLLQKKEKPDIGSALKIGDDFIENKWIRLRVNSQTGIVEELRYLPMDQSLISSKWGFNELISQQRNIFFNGVDLNKAQQLAPKKTLVKVIDRRPVSVQLHVIREGYPMADTVWTLYSDHPWVDVNNKFHFDHPDLSIATTAVYLFWPFEMPGARHVMEMPLSFVETRKDQLPGSQYHKFRFQRGGMLTSQSYSVLWSSRDLGIFSPGTEVKDAPPGLLAFVLQDANPYEPERVTLQLHYRFEIRKGTADRIELERFLQEAHRPVVARKIDSVANWKKTSQSFVKIEPEGTVLKALKESEDQKGYVIRIWNPRDKSVNVKITLPEVNVTGAWLCNTVEEQIGSIKHDAHVITLDMKPSDVTTLYFTVGSDR